MLFYVKGLINKKYEQFIEEGNGIGMFKEGIAMAVS